MSGGQPLSTRRDSRFTRPPILVGYTFEPAEAYRARDEERLLAIRLETNRSCNLRCRYCYAISGKSLRNELSLNVLADVVRQAKDLGAQSIVVIGGGEPTLHPRFRPLIALIHRLDMVPMIFTNAMKTTPALAGFLFDCNASVMTKLDSLTPATQDFLAGVSGAFDRMQQGIENLLAAGFGKPSDPHRLRLGASFVSCRANLNEVENIWRFCRQRNIFPNMEVLTPTGRAKDELDGQGLTLDEIRRYKLRILDLDRREYGLDWLPYTPLAASGCLQHLYSLYVTIEGNVRPCAPAKFDEHPSLRVGGVYPHNILRRPLAEIYRDELFQYVRSIDRHLEGKCRNCPHNDECIGCRGYAYSVGVNQGLQPRQALAGQCLQCFR